MSERDNLVDKNAGRNTGEGSSLAGEAMPDDQADAAAEPGSSTAVPQAGAESVSEDIAGSGIATGEVRAVQAPSANATSNRPLVAAVIVLVLIVAGYFLIIGSSPEQLPQAAEAERRPIPKRPVIDKQIEVKVVEQQQVVTVATRQEDEGTVAATVAVAEASQKAEQEVARPQAEKVIPQAATLYQVVVGPYLNSAALKLATSRLKDLGFEAQTVKGRGMVTMIRLREGVYPADEARRRLDKIKTRARSAFLLPDGNKRALYVGFFVDPERAASYIEELSKKGVKVTEVRSEMEMSGNMLIALKADQDTARQVAALLNKSGLQTQIVRN